VTLFVHSYGYKSLELFVDAATELRNNPSVDPHKFNTTLATMQTCSQVTAILEAGRLSLNSKGAAMIIECDVDGSCLLTNIWSGFLLMRFSLLQGMPSQFARNEAPFRSPYHLY
jgi:hypothetical protein